MSVNISKKQNQPLHAPRVYCSKDLTVGDKSLFRSLLWYPLTQHPSAERIGSDTMQRWNRVQDSLASFSFTNGISSGNLNTNNKTAALNFQAVGSFWLKKEKKPPTNQWPSAEFHGKTFNLKKKNFLSLSNGGIPG